jgi:hypothetical protein
MRGTIKAPERGGECRTISEEALEFPTWPWSKLPVSRIQSSTWSSATSPKVGFRFPLTDPATPPDPTAGSRWIIDQIHSERCQNTRQKLAMMKDAQRLAGSQCFPEQASMGSHGQIESNWMSKWGLRDWCKA